MKLHSWEKIKNHFTDNLLLGNGASIAVHAGFSYQSLYQAASEAKFLDENLKALFASFKTTDFEHVLKLLSETNRVNSIVGIKDDITARSYQKLRGALVKTIHSVHPQYDDVKQYLSPMADFMKHFHTALSLNYDLLVYWAMLVGNDKYGPHFKDCFPYREFENDFGYLYEPQPPATGATLVFYPHGNLVLATKPFEAESKLSRSKEDCLLDTIISKWGLEEYTPLFVSEGDTDQKIRTLERNGYLNVVYNSVLANLEESLVIYGWSFDLQDTHILKALARTELQRVAISVHTTEKDREDWESFCTMVELRVRNTPHMPKFDILFFDAESKGCWVN